MFNIGTGLARTVNEVGMHKEIKARASQVNELVEREGICVVHTIAANYYPEARGGVTVALRAVAKSPLLEVAVATCSPGDDFDRKVGRVMAVDALLRGECIRVPNRGGTSLKEFAQRLGMVMLFPTSACGWLS